MTARISPADLRALLRRPEGELALLDVREEGVFARGHLLTASNLPLSRLELRLDALVPRRGTPVVLCDDGDGLAERAAARMQHFGYTDVSILDGGVGAMTKVGSVLFEGVHVPSKAFGELVEQTCDTPRITPAELRRLQESGTDMVVLDSRPFGEYRRMNIPGGINVPGAELVHRVHDLAPNPDTLVVVNCAGRTRSIIGAQSLINAGVPNRVVALENGTMGWALAGLPLESGQSRRPPEITPQTRQWARAAAEKVAERFSVPSVDVAGLRRWQAEADRQTLYLFDVRLPDEYAAGHIAGARNAPGGQLVQATDSYIGTRGGRIVLVDDDGVRATMTASWLIQMGWTDVHRLADPENAAQETGPERVTVLGLDECDPETLTAEAVAARKNDVLVVDLATSREYLAGHIPGACFAIRSRLAEKHRHLSDYDTLVLTSPDGTLAAIAAAEAEAVTGRPVKVLAGGTNAWRKAGYCLTEGAEYMLDERDDVYILPYEHATGVEEAMKAYLNWETALVPQVEADGSLRFHFVPPES